MGSALARKTKAAINPAAAGKDARYVEKRTDTLTKNWNKYRSAENAVQNGPAIRNWIKYDLGLDDPQIWNLAIKEFRKNYPKSAEKYENDVALDNAETSNFFNTIIRARIAKPHTQFWGTQDGKEAKLAKDTAKNTVKVKSAPKVKNDQPSEFNAPHTTANKTDDTPETQPEVQQPAVPGTFAPKPVQTPNAAATAQPNQTSTTDTAPSEEEPEKTTGNLDWDAIRKRFPDKT
jgi:hypothetical protein